MRGARRGAAGRSRRGCRGRRRRARREPVRGGEPAQAEVRRHQRAAAHAHRQPAARQGAGEGHAPRACGAHDGSGRRRDVDAAALPARERRARGRRGTRRRPDRAAASATWQLSLPPRRVASPGPATVTHAKASEARTMGCGRGGIGRRYGREERGRGRPRVICCSRCAKPRQSARARRLLPVGPLAIQPKPLDAARVGDLTRRAGRVPRSPGSGRGAAARGRCCPAPRAAG